MNKTQVTALLKEMNAARTKRLELTEEAAKLEQREKSIADQLNAAKVKAGVYGSYVLKVKDKKVPRCTDWPGLYAFIKEQDSFDMLHKRLTETAVMARVDQGEYVPGIAVDTKTTYTITPK